MITGKRKAEIEDFDNYCITENGYIYHISNYNHEYGPVGELSSRLDKRSGYLTVRLSQNGKVYTRYIHRLLATAFIKNTQKKPFINHKSGNKLDNSLSNLEWCSHSENISHAYKTGLINLKTKSVIDTYSGRIYNNVKEAAEDCGLNYGTLRNYLNGNIKTNPTYLQYWNKVLKFVSKI
jgi:hypothetical protein